MNHKMSSKRGPASHSEKNTEKTSNFTWRTASLANLRMWRDEVEPFAPSKMRSLGTSTWGCFIPWSVLGSLGIRLLCEFAKCFSYRYWESLPLRWSRCIILDVEKRLVSFVHHETNCVSQSITWATWVPAGIDHVDFCLNLIRSSLQLTDFYALLDFHLLVDNRRLVEKPANPDELISVFWQNEPYWGQPPTKNL